MTEPTMQPPLELQSWQRQMVLLAEPHTAGIMVIMLKLNTIQNIQLNIYI